ncbi:PREDICTED: glutamic acid-rich protein-like [Camelina sativa]|uniref:Glutamic acid-rich protein-like n=1 Tax=Camelina sativa TaxID=90675 RepID=A0ABM0YJ22_CAMSA|nr:PREDICTED: glutamic acid-rich protein-like [Camelina sativa]
MARTRGGKNTFVPPPRSLRLTMNTPEKDSIQTRSEAETVEILSDTEADRIEEMSEKDGPEADRIEEENEKDGSDGTEAERFIEEKNGNDGLEAERIKVETEKDGPEAERLVEENKKDGLDADRIEEENEKDGPEMDRIEVETAKDGPAERFVEETAKDQNSKAVPKRKRKRKIAEDIEDDRAVSGDDCEVVGDEDCDEVRYADEGNREEDLEDQRWSIVAVPERYCEPNVDYVEERDNDNIGIEEENFDDFEAEFGSDAREDDGDEIDGDDSGDDIWDEERIPDLFHIVTMMKIATKNVLFHKMKTRKRF